MPIYFAEKRSSDCVTTRGDPCVFPFTYGGGEHNGCTLYQAIGGRPWCGTRADASRYGNCDMDVCESKFGF